MSYTVSTSPHITDKGNSTRRIMLDVLIALIPSIIAAVIFFGYHVLINLAFCAIFCFGLELLWSMLIKKEWSKKGIMEASSWDFSSLVTAVILALNLPSTVNVWGLNIVGASGRILFSFDTVLVCLIGSIVAIVLVKQLFGGIGRNFANPAATARAFLLIAFSFSSVQTLNAFGMDASTGATWLSNKSLKSISLLDMFLGNVGSAAVGETCVIAIILGYVYLSIRKVIDWRIPLMIIGWSAIFALLFDGAIKSKLSGGELWLNLGAHVLSGGLIFGAVFMATDYATSPNTFIGNCVFCFGIALFTMLIRVFAHFPEGISFAILIMNCLTPLIDKYIVPRPFGYVKKEKKKEMAK